MPKEQALRVQVWERRFEGAISELDEHVANAVDQDVLSERLVAFVTLSHYFPQECGVLMA